MQVRRCRRAGEVRPSLAKLAEGLLILGGDLARFGPRMTKADLIDVIAERLRLPRGRADLLVTQVFDSMVEGLRRGDRIEIRGFGSFSIREYRSYQGRNPRTGERVVVKAKRLAFFKVGKELRERVNGEVKKSGTVAGRAAGGA